jgi:pimeloyl-ACP methyl ester carboxylesterase
MTNSLPNRIETTLVEVGGVRIEVRKIPASRAASTTLVFLHEGLGSVSLWRDFPDRIAATTGLRTIVYSRRGYGRSDPAPLPRPVRFMHEEAASALPALLDAFAARDTILVGHSDGASIALLYASARPSGLRGVVVLAPHVFVEDVTVASIERAREAYARTDLRARLARHHGANVDVAFRGWNNVWLDPAFRSWNIESEVQRIDIPVLVIQGKDDEYGTLAQVASIQRRATGPVDTLVLDACGHSPHKDQPDATAAAIATFVDRLATR